MTRSKLSLFILLLIFSITETVKSQDMGGYSKQEVKDLSSKVEDQIRFLEYFLNTVGSQETPARDKDVIIRESYQKIFRDGKVQVEDDLLLDRKVITNKDITAYLKDIEFFFKDANFKFKVKEVKPFLRDNGELSFLVSMDRTLTAVGLNKEKISNTKQRFIEVNVDKRSNELKIASIYTTKLSRDKELMEWWSRLSYTWSNYFREKIGLSDTDSVTVEHLYKISAIDSIDFSNNQFINDLQPIEALRELKYINISNTKIKELKPISNVTFLSHLDISNTPTSDIQFIKYSDRLAYLDISNTSIKDVSELGNLKALTTLKMSKTPIASFGVLNSFDKLKYLNLSESGFNNFENINELTDLLSLDVSNNYLINFEELSSLVSLEELNLQQTNILDLTPLSGLNNLRVLNINQTEVGALDVLNGRFSIQKIYADRTRITEQEADEFARRNRRVLLIHHVENLQTWWNDLDNAWKQVLSGINPALERPVPTIEALTQTVGIDSLILNGSAISELGPVLKFKKINYLAFDNTAVQDLSPLAEMRTLNHISGKNSYIRSLSPLVNLRDLEILDLSNNPVASISVVKDLPALTYLNVDGASFDRIEIPDFLMANLNVNVIYRSSELEAWWSGLEDDWKAILKDQFGHGKEPTLDDLHRWTASPYLLVEKASISNLEPIQAFVNLRKLHVFDVPLTDMSAVRQMYLLEDLKISQAPVSDLNMLVGLRSLKKLDLSNTGIEDLRPLGVHSQLEVLKISGTNIKILKGLETLRGLQELDIASTNVKSLKPIQGLPELRKLTCFNTRLTSRAVDGFKKLNPACEVRFY